MTAPLTRLDRRKRRSIDADSKIADGSWSDPKRYLWLLVPSAPGAVTLSWLLAWTTGLHIFWWTALALILAIGPGVDHLLGLEKRNRAPDRILAELQEDTFYRFATHVYLPTQYLALAFACWVWAGGGWVTLTTTDKVALMVAVGLSGGIANNAAHELGHRRAGSERWLSKLALAQTCYGQFYVEHNRGHHVRVATPEDPASARFGESVYYFFVRSVFGSTRSAWQLEAKRLERHGYSRWSLRNDVLNAWLLSIALFTGLAIWFRPVVLPWLVGQALIGIFLLEAMNYLSHYGLRRHKLPSGRYERLRASHSWNSNTVIMNVFLLHLQRHSDHHADPSHRYQGIRHAEDAPQLPGNYVAMLVLSLFPMLWRRVMDPRVLAIYGGDIRLTALSPRQLKRLPGA
ncbi:alkane 1-monooxygenase [Mycobacterium sp. CBMA293]|uniref:alkane 1-monooxygenase n=1 Tax=unclassified Mycolicibacterium TaxID=2636767 RepID=UPI0012DF9A3B|nr:MULTISPECIES: alkane 1-monooxygenase [unclassified Mycolicibacterium]MUL49185.1 alkane 1-monooxygenase [Mycolicibacterium sp. CBMA 360]MUL60783.1 alkane 1-monooxygenase [Mycolicibacterium sp. CBMA 335]MUL71796.1 alkane 1-monooxygenase [Mycolicibacterium sp. CBMA 311]MUL95724.1 alkane 1-monooxygenase [Mycolicibacterium sp. CBMA 230]MUM03534.1 alkane 1-monooxygenase [Mycolicibacterium sp. CBMA 213]